jgi:hypothetical protein
MSEQESIVDSVDKDGPTDPPPPPAKSETSDVSKDLRMVAYNDAIKTAQTLGIAITVLSIVILWCILWTGVQKTDGAEIPFVLAHFILMFEALVMFAAHLHIRLSRVWTDDDVFISRVFKIVFVVFVLQSFIPMTYVIGLLDNDRILDGPGRGTPRHSGAYVIGSFWVIIQAVFHAFGISIVFGQYTM